MIETIIKEVSDALQGGNPHTYIVGNKKDMNRQGENKEVFPFILLDNAIRSNFTINLQSTFSTDYIISILFLDKATAQDELGVQKVPRVEAMELLAYEFTGELITNVALNQKQSIIAGSMLRLYNIFDLGLDGVMLELTVKVKEHFTPCPANNKFLGVKITDPNNENSPVLVPAGKEYACVSATRTYDPQADNGSRTSYTNGDSPWQVANVFNNVPAGIINRRDPNDNTKVLELNEFGNLELLTDEDGLQVFNNEYFVQHITGLGYHLPANLFANSGSFFFAINEAMGTDWGGNNNYMGFTDWVPATLKQLRAIFNEDGLFNKLGYPPINLVGGRVWTPDTTIANFFAYCIDLDVGLVNGCNKFGESHPFIPVRRHNFNA